MSARQQVEAPISVLPQRLGKYEIVGLLGEGAMGRVYKAIDPHIGRAVAIKTIRPSLLGAGAHDVAALQRFRTEAQAAGRLNHPNIVAVHEYGHDRDQHHIVMEFVEGVSLLQLTAHGRRLPIGDVCSVMQQLLDALACAHAQGIWHRDIKPANLLVTADGRLKVSDFGIARVAAAELTQQLGGVLGSPGYMAPERYTGEAPDRRVDIFSCGVLLYELLTGRTPFRADTGSATMYRVLNELPPAPSTLAIADPPPARFDAIVALAIARRPVDRYADAAEMREALRVAAGRPIAPSVSIATMMRPRDTDAGDTPTQVLPRRAPDSLAAWDATLLERLEALLVPQLGPVARLVVRAAARRGGHAHALVARIAAEALDPGERDAFVAAAQALLPARPAAPAAVATALPVLGDTPMAGDVAARAERVLVEHIGPIAGLIVRRAAAASRSREQFYAALADQAGAEVDRRQLLAQLWRL
jgi:hypothetical protein